MRSGMLIELARESIRSHFDHHPMNRETYISSDPQLLESGASFVTLTLHGKLRGCIGSIIAHRPLIDDLISNAQSAAFHDPRFMPLSPEEFEQVDVEVSILTPPKAIEYKSRDDLSQIIRPHIDGVILKYRNHQATFLPQVWDELSDFEVFFSHLGMKAGIGSNPLAYHPEIYVYQVEKFQDGTCSGCH